MNPPHISYEPGVLRILDQTQLPGTIVFTDLRSWPEVAQAIAQLRVRGAPAIGIAGAYGLAIAAHAAAKQGLMDADFMRELQRAAAGLIAARPTAVNLGWAVDRQIKLAASGNAAKAPPLEIAASLDSGARKIHEDDINACRRIGENGAALLRPGARILTHCNTGDLATGGYGTALGVIRSAWQAGKVERVYVSETRPLLQGARLTTWELMQDRIPHVLITDSMAAHFMQRKLIDVAIVGADRIARNGDTANKIGTYGLAVLARAHGLPFIVAAPSSTFDPAMASGGEIVIEERDPQEVATFAGARSAPAGVVAANPAFDITPAEYITAIATEARVLHPPLDNAIADMLSRTPSLASATR